VEKKLSAKNFELQNKIAAVKMNADQAIKSKTNEIAGLKVAILEETKARDAAVQDTSDSLAAMEESLLAKSKQVEQLSKDFNAVRADADATVKVKENELKRMDALVAELQKNALNEKTAIESKMQAELDLLRNNSEEAVSRCNSQVGDTTFLYSLNVISAYYNEHVFISEIYLHTIYYSPGALISYLSACPTSCCRCPSPSEGGAGCQSEGRSQDTES